MKLKTNKMKNIVTNIEQDIDLEVETFILNHNKHKIFPKQLNLYEKEFEDIIKNNKNRPGRRLTNIMLLKEPKIGNLKIKKSLLKEISNFYGDKEKDNVRHLPFIIREYLGVKETQVKEFGEVTTPEHLVNDMLDTLPEEVWSNPNLKWLDPCNGIGVYPAIIVTRLMKGLNKVIRNREERYKHIMENMLYVCEIQTENMAAYQTIFDPYDKVELNIHNGSFLDRRFDRTMHNKWKVDKFDIIIANPPYNQMIDMDFLKKSYVISDKVLFVHPSTWLLDEKNKQKKFTSTKELIANDLESIVLFNGNGVFGISLFVPCVITYVNKNKKTRKIKCYDRINKVEILYNDIKEINKYSNLNEYESIKNKFKAKSQIDNLLNHKNILYGNNYVNISQIRGDVKFRDKLDIGMDEIMVADSFYTIITKDTINEKEKTKHMFFSFKTENQSNNFINYLKSKVCRFALSIYKNNSQLDRGEMGLIPYLDFTQEWTDEKLYKHFKLTNEEIAFIEKHIPKYY